MAWRYYSGLHFVIESNIRLDLNENMLQILTNSSYNCIYHLNRYSLTIIKLCLKKLYYNFEFIFLYIIVVWNCIATGLIRYTFQLNLVKGKGQPQ